jgi:thymidylate synthase
MQIMKNSTLEAWKESLKLISEEGREIVDRDGRTSKEVMNMTLAIKEPYNDILAPIEAMKSLKKWAYPELDELEDVFFKKESSFIYYYTYGRRIFNYSNTKNQVDDFIIPLLKKDPETRRAVVMIYDPVLDSGLDVKETPGLISIFFKVIEGKLAATTIIRSNDMFIGWPANIYQIYLLQKYVADKLGLQPGSITTISHSAHLFTEYNEEIRAVLAKK